jgi:biopolymer transport protein TolQ
MGDFSIIDLLRHTGMVVMVVLALLLLASVASWTVIFRKYAELATARAQTDKFEESFWSGGDLTTMFRGIEQSRKKTLGMERIFEAGFREFARLRQQSGMTAAQLLEGSRRAMRIALLKESDRLEKSLGMLASTGSISPYVGLFGTVWGIMEAFHGLGNQAQVTIATVAPHISEALVATAMGLFAAIPATLAYNRYAEQVGRLESRFDTFVEELSTILQRYATAKPTQTQPLPAQAVATPAPAQS